MELPPGMFVRVDPDADSLTDILFRKAKQYVNFHDITFIWIFETN